MIVRIVRGRLAPERLDDARDALTTAGLLPSAPRPGLVRSHVGARYDGDRLDVVSIEFWTTPEAIEAAEAAAPDGPPTVPAVLGRLMKSVESAHFEVDEMVLRASTEDPVAIRLTLGQFSQPGADIEMLELLRERVPRIGPEMTESYVGRRMVGRAVEIALVSVFVAEPAERPLERPFWPDAVLRYDQFMLAVYAPIERQPRRSG